jgi:hypothetical protein
LGVSVTNGCLLAHAAKPPVEAPIEAAARPALSRWSCRGVVEAA